MGNLGASARARRRWLGWLFVVAALAASLVACGKSSSAGSSSSSTAAASTAGQGSSSSSGSGCGTVPKIPVKDASGLIASLPPQYAAAYNGYSGTVYKSPWAHFKPKGSGPYTIGFLDTVPVDGFQSSVIKRMPGALQKIKGVGKVTLLTSSVTGVTAQIQQANQMIQQKASVIVVQAIAPPAFVSVVRRAAQAGIPVISIVNSVPSPYAINLAPNSVADALDSGAALARMIDGKGTVLGLHGIRSTGIDQDEFTGWKAVFARCPGITLNDSLTGNFEAPVAKQAVLSYLSSHPQPVAGVVETATMGGATIQAFAQTGRSQPPLVDIGATAGDLAYWNAHKGSFRAIAATITPTEIIRVTAYTVSHLLSGQGPKISVMTQPSPTITAQNLSQWVIPGAGANDARAADGPGVWLSDSFLAPLFNK